MNEREIEELKKQVQSFIRSNKVSFILNGKPLDVCKIDQLIILFLKEGEFSNGNNYSFEGEIEVLIPTPTQGDIRNLFGKISGNAEIEIEQENGKLKGIKIIKVSPISLTKK